MSDYCSPLAAVLLALPSAFVMVLPVSSHAEESPSVAVDFEGDIRPRGEVRANHHFGLGAEDVAHRLPDTLDSVSQRARLGLSVAHQEWTALLQLQYASLWGTTGGAELTDPALGMHQAWVRYAPTDWLSLQLGRFEVAYGDHRVLGNVGWHQLGRAWDGARASIGPFGGVGVDAFVLQYREGSPGLESGNFLQDDAYLSGFYATITSPVQPFLQGVDAYVLHDVRIDRLGHHTPQRRHLVTIGSRVHGEWSLVDATVEGAIQPGQQCVEGEDGRCTDETRSILGYFVDSELGASLDLGFGLRVFAGFSQASGDDPETETIESYDQLYPTGHRWLGRMDIVGPRSNVREIRGGVSARVGKFTLSEAVHNFERLQPTTERLGLELNTTLGYAVTDGIGVSAGHGLFVPDSGISRSEEDPQGLANWAYLQVTAAF